MRTVFDPDKWLDAADTIAGTDDIDGPSWDYFVEHKAKALQLMQIGAAVEAEEADKSEAVSLRLVMCGPMQCARAYGHPGSHMTAEEWETASQPCSETEKEST